MLPTKKGILALSIIMSFSFMKANDDLHKVTLYHNDASGFNLDTPRGLIPIQRCYMDQELRGISSERLSKLITTGAYLSVSKLNNSDDHMLRLKGRLNGGGPVIGKAAFWITKIGGYAGLTILCIVHPGHVAELPHMREVVDAASHAAELVGTIIPGP